MCSWTQKSFVNIWFFFFFWCFYYFDFHTLFCFLFDVPFENLCCRVVISFLSLIFFSSILESSLYWFKWNVSQKGPCISILYTSLLNQYFILNFNSQDFKYPGLHSPDILHSGNVFKGHVTQNHFVLQIFFW